MDSSRITLRPFRLTDVDDLVPLAGDDQLTQFTHLPAITSKEDALTFINKCISSNIPWGRSICIDDRLVGLVMVFPGSGDDGCRAALGGAVASDYWGQGIGVKAMKMAILILREEFPEIVRFETFSYSEHKACHRALEKAGFVREATLRKYKCFKGKIKDVVLHSLL